MTGRTWTWIAGAAVVACVAVLLADYGVATWQAPRDDKIVKALQQQVKSDAAVAGRLVGEQKRVTGARRARKSRDSAVAWILIGTASVFLTLAKRIVGLAPRPARGSQPRPASPGARGALWARPAGVPTPPALDLTFVDELVAKEGPGKESAIILLQAIQSHYGYLPDEAMRRLCELTEITPAQLAGTSSFYGQFRGTPVGKHLVRVCHGTACHVAGARQITDELRRYLAIPEGADTDSAGMFTVGEVACLGCCSLAPVLIVDGHTAGRLTPSSASAALEHVEERETA
jgi:NADH:ubiquinone oxidoreductase subunit E